MTEAEFQYILRVLCQHDAYADLQNILTVIGDELAALSDETGALLREYFAGAHGAKAFASGMVLANGKVVDGDGWDVEEVEVDPAVCPSVCLPCSCALGQGLVWFG
jgi:hypothetical protein